MDRCARHSQSCYPDVCSDKRVQHLKFLLRDWNDDHGGLGDERAQEVLRAAMAVDHLQPISDSIRSHFQKVDCCLLPHPGDCIKDPAYDGRIEGLAEEYVVKLQSLISGILDIDELEVKQIDGVDLTFIALLGYVERYVEQDQSDAEMSTKLLKMSTAASPSEPHPQSATDPLGHTGIVPRIHKRPYVSMQYDNCGLYVLFFCV